MKDLKRLDGETENQTLWRIGNDKAAGLYGYITWKDVSDFMNKEFRDGEENYFDSSAYRKRYKNFSDAYEEIFSKSQFSESRLDEISEQIRELEKAKIKLRDERIDYQRSLREDARRESFIELVERAMKKNIDPFEYKPSPIIDSEEDMIVCLSDLHVGIEVSNWWNVYNVDVLKNRLHKYLDEIRSVQQLHRCKMCYLVLGGDAISGIIHQNLRLQNNENVIEQLKIVITYIGEFVYTMQDWFDGINVYSVSGNHSRISPNKEEHIKGEELEEMIPFCLKLQFSNNDKVEICDYMACKIDSTIAAFKTRGEKLFYIVHGDHDTPVNVVKNLTLMSGVKPDGIIMGHRHNNSLSTEHGVKVVQCGCVVGMDDYSVDKRISGEPEQCVVITSKNRAVKCLYDIGL